MKSSTIIDVAKILPDDAIGTRAECTAAAEAARAICCVARTGSICFGPDGNVIEDCSRSKTKKRNKMKEDIQGRWKKEEEKISRLPHPLSSSSHVDILNLGRVEEMSQKHNKLVRNPSRVLVLVGQV